MSHIVPLNYSSEQVRGLLPTKDKDHDDEQWSAFQVDRWRN